ncbi:MAG: hypothetical protein AABY10_01940 [Nanoarchaeota archaeon]
MRNLVLGAYALSAAEQISAGKTSPLLFRTLKRDLERMFEYSPLVFDEETSLDGSREMVDSQMKEDPTLLRGVLGLAYQEPEVEVRKTLESLGRLVSENGSQIDLENTLRFYDRLARLATHLSTLDRVYGKNENCLVGVR